VVSGTNLAAGGVDPVVKVGAVQAVVVAASPTEVTFTVPIPAVTAKITVTNPGGVPTSGPSLTVTP
jgi:IPT/TIG domain-containing protein